MATEARKKFKLVNVRLSWPALFKPREGLQNDDGSKKGPEYSANFILDNTEHAKIIKQIKAEAERIATEKWGRVPVKFKYPVRPGTDFRDDDDNFKDGYSEDVSSITAKSQNKQHVVCRDLSPAGPEDVYAGCYVIASIELYAWEHKKNGKGVSANLGPVQFYKNGERFGGSVMKPEDAGFEDLGELDDDDEEPAPKKKKKPRPADDDDDEDETPAPKKKKKPRPSDDDDDDLIGF